MRGKNDRVSILPEPLHALHHAAAVAVIEIRRRFVHDEHRRILHQCPRQKHQLPLAAADFHAAAIGELFHPERTEHLHGFFPLRLAGLLKNAQLRGHAHEDAV